MPNINDFTGGKLGDPILGNPFIPDPGGSESGFIVQSIRPGLKQVTTPDGNEYITDEFGNIIG